MTVKVILAQADAHLRRTGKWPRTSSGPVAGAPGETWRAVDEALRYGRRGLPGGSSLGLVLSEHRGLPAPTNKKPLTVEQILAWADSYRRRTGCWPTENSGPVAEAPAETWNKVNAALRLGARGLPAGRSLGRLLAEERGVRNRTSLPPLTVEEVLAWADSHRQRTGRWPGRTSGAVPEAPGETWGAIALALRNGYRGLPRGKTLRGLLIGRGAPETSRTRQEEAARRYQAGESLRQVALALGVSPESVRQMLVRRGVSRRTGRRQQQ